MGERIGQRLWPIAHDHAKIALILVGGVAIQIALAATANVWRVPDQAEPLVALLAFSVWLYIARVAGPSDLDKLVRRFRQRAARDT